MNATTNRELDTETTEETTKSQRPIAIAAYVDKELYERVRFAAYKEHISMAEIIRRAVDAFLVSEIEEAA